MKLLLLISAVMYLANWSAAAHSEYLVVDESEVDRQGILSSITSKSDCECQQRCHLSLVCSKTSRFEDASCFTPNHTNVHRRVNLQELFKEDDGLYYSVPEATKLNHQDCIDKCGQLPGFRIPQAKTEQTMAVLKKHSKYQYWIGLQKYSNLTASEPGFSGRTKDVGHMWDDGTLLDGNALKLAAGEPVTSSGAAATHYVLWSTKNIDDAPPTNAYHCMCQANLDNIPIY